MWDQDWRSTVWHELPHQRWDLVVIGGGITGAGVLREAVRAGFNTLLVEAHDFGSGTSSRSSKLVHGGFRYLKNAQIRMTYESVRERERLLKEGRGLVTPLGFLMPSYRTDRLPGWAMGFGLAIYDLLALKWSHRYYDAYDIHELSPMLNESGLQGGYRFFDAQTDDARLVLRLIREAVRQGGMALNYARVHGLLRNAAGRVCGIRLVDTASDGERQSLELQAGLVINATGAWADELRAQIQQPARLRSLRGSHLVIPGARLQITRAVSFWHPRDQRPVFIMPWEGVTLVGTTDVDHASPLATDPAISAAETQYLLEAVNFAFPEAAIVANDLVASFAGIRPVVNTGKQDPSKESREHVLWCESGLLTVTGGKLTTFRRMAHAALRAACREIHAPRPHTGSISVLDAPPGEISFNPALSPKHRLRIVGRYGADAGELMAMALPEDLAPIPGTPYLQAELRWAARQEGVVHLDDLLLRRLRLGLLLPQGGMEIIAQIRNTALPGLGWSDERWDEEVRRYRQLWQRVHAVKC